MKDIQIHPSHDMRGRICHTCGANFGTPEWLGKPCGTPRWSVPARSGTPGLGQPTELVFPPARLGTRGRS